MNDPVVEANRALLLKRSQLGINKYGVTLASSGLSRRQLLQHALEESLDLANYLQAELMREDAPMVSDGPWAAGNTLAQSHKSACNAAVHAYDMFTHRTGGASAPYEIAEAMANAETDLKGDRGLPPDLQSSSRAYRWGYMWMRGMLNAATSLEWDTAALCLTAWKAGRDYQHARDMQAVQHHAV